MLVWQGESSTRQILFLWMFFQSSVFIIFRMGVCVSRWLWWWNVRRKSTASSCKLQKLPSYKFTCVNTRMNLWSLIGHYLQSQNITLPLLKAGAIPKPHTLRLLPGYAFRLPNDLPGLIIFNAEGLDVFTAPLEAGNQGWNHQRTFFHRKLPQKKKVV